MVRAAPLFFIKADLIQIFTGKTSSFPYSPATTLSRILLLKGDEEIDVGGCVSQPSHESKSLERRGEDGWEQRMQGVGDCCVTVLGSLWPSRASQNL